MTEETAPDTAFKYFLYEAQKGDRSIIRSQLLGVFFYEQELR